MRLEAFFAAIRPFLEGRTDHAAAVAALYPDAPEGPDARRLAVYARQIASSRLSALEYLFPETQRVVLAHQGEPGWERLCAAYFEAHPMRSWVLCENGEHFPGFLKTVAPLPAWLPALADLEWWCWATQVAPDAPEDAHDEGPLRLAATAELRPYDHAIFDFWQEICDDDDPLPVDAAPAPRAQLVLFYRDRALLRTMLPPEPLTLAVLKAVFEGAGLAATAAAVGVPAERLLEHAAAMHADGLLRGRLEGAR